jgi:hypothetical protein
MNPQSESAQSGPFRQAAVERVNNLEQLDGLLTVTTPRSWIALSAIAVLIAVALGWSVIDLHDEMWRGAGIPHDLAPPHGSYIDLAFRQHRPDVRFPATMNYADVALWIDHLRTNIGLDATLRSLQASHRQLEAKYSALERERDSLAASVRV